MPSLSIVIPVAGSTAGLEETLLSILEDRPADSEVIAVLGCAYDNPYGLEDEVRLVEARDRGTLECLTQGIEEATAPIVHIAAPGIEVSAGWTDAPLAQFDDPQVAAVAPLVLDNSESRRIVAAGVNYFSGGAVRPRSRGRAAAKAAKLKDEVLAAPPMAGFYRRKAIDAVGGFHMSLDPGAAELDLGLRLRHAGYATRFEPGSEVFAAGWQAPASGWFRHGFQRQRLFWRNAPLVGWKRSLALHPMMWAADLLASLRRPARLASPLGRLLNAFELSRHRRHWRQLAELTQRETTEASQPIPSDSGRRVDPPQDPLQRRDRSRASASAQS